MNRFLLGPYFNQLNEAMQAGEDARTVLKQLHVQIAEALPADTPAHEIQSTVRRVAEGVMINDIVNRALAGRDQLAPYGLGSLSTWRGRDLLNAHPSDLTPVDFQNIMHPFTSLSRALEVTVSTHVNFFFDTDASHLEGLKKAFGGLYRVQHMAVSAQKADLSSALASAGRAIGGALRAIALHFSELPANEKLVRARRSFPALVTLASVPLHVGWQLDPPGGDAPILLPDTFMPSEDRSALRVNRERIKEAYQSARSPIGIHTGCPALATLGEEDHAIRKLWNWSVDTVESAGFYERD